MPNMWGLENTTILYLKAFSVCLSMLICCASICLCCSGAAGDLKKPRPKSGVNMRRAKTGVARPPPAEHERANEPEPQPEVAPSLADEQDV
jgi:hypothetical protein